MEEIHKKVKELRVSNDLTLKDLAEKTGLSVSFLSSVERGATSLAITSLKKIADALDVTMSYFFEEEVKSSFHVKLEQQKAFRVENSASSFVRLGGQFPKRALEPLIVTLAPKQQKEHTFTHPGEEFYYVLHGAVLFEIDGEDYYVRQGETIHFPSHIAHEFENPLNEESVLLCVLTPVIF
ncbi:helix-turn-helix domain-containing protein [Paenibacillus sp. GCM10027628]|uniref:helix-turn-helix domain-containing protein n=1 Tax=Paenibacillus sp. GCM10027628 TaxID=3273413 RepID=UPI0036350F63